MNDPLAWVNLIAIVSMSSPTATVTSVKPGVATITFTDSSTGSAAEPVTIGWPQMYPGGRLTGT